MSFLFKVDNKKVYLRCANMGITVTEAYRKAGISCTTHSRINKGMPVNSKTMGKLAKALSCNVIEIMEE